MYKFEWLTSLTVGDRAICPRPLLSATQSVPRACIVDVKLASASASAYRRSRGVEHVFDLTGWARTAAHRRRADPPASTDRRVGRARSRARCYECLWALHIQQYSRVSVIFTHRVGVRCECACVRGGRRWRWLSCGPPCLDLGPELGWVIIKWAGVMHPASIFAQTPRLASCPLACRPRTQRKPPAAARTHSMTRKKHA